MDLPDTLVIAAVTGAGGWLGNMAVQWLKGRETRHGIDRKIDAELGAHWTKTTLALVDTLRVELEAAKSEISALRPMESRIAHLEEALDHIQALLVSATEAERRAAETRAHAFMQRMRRAA